MAGRCRRLVLAAARRGGSGRGWADPSSRLMGPVVVASLASIAGRRRPEVPLELPIEVLLAAIADRQRYRFDLRAGFDHFRGALQPDACHALVDGEAEYRAKHMAEVRGLAADGGAERTECHDVGIVAIDFVEHAADEKLTCDRHWCDLKRQAPCRPRACAVRLNARQHAKLSTEKSQVRDRSR